MATADRTTPAVDGDDAAPQPRRRRRPADRRARCSRTPRRPGSRSSSSGRRGPGRPCSSTCWTGRPRSCRSRAAASSCGRCSTPSRDRAGSRTSSGPRRSRRASAASCYWSIDRLCGGKRYLDKFPRNCLRGEYLYELFPDARFVAIHRDGRSAVSSLITGWQTAGKFGQGTNLPVTLDIAGLRRRQLEVPGAAGLARVRDGAHAGRGVRVPVVGGERGDPAREGAHPCRPVDRGPVRGVPGRAARDGVATARGRGPPAGGARCCRGPTTLDTHVSRTAVSDPSRDKWRTEHGRGDRVDPAADRADDADARATPSRPSRASGRVRPCARRRPAPSASRRRAAGTCT